MHNANVVLRWDCREGKAYNFVGGGEGGEDRGGATKTKRHQGRMFGETFSHCLQSVERADHCPFQIGPEAKEISEVRDRKGAKVATTTAETKERMGFYEGFRSAEN